MDLKKILQEVSDKFYENKEFKRNKDFFANKFCNAGTLALGYINNLLKGLDVFYLCVLDPKYRHLKPKDNDNLDFLSEESISKYILDYKTELCNQDTFNHKFLEYLISCRQDLLNIINAWTNKLLQEFSADFISQVINCNDHDIATITDMLPLYVINSFSQSDIFEIMYSNNSDFLQSRLNVLQSVFTDKDIENQALKAELKKYTIEKPQPITKKANLIKLLDFCNDFKTKNPNAKPEKIIKAFEDKEIYFGGWKSWEPFFIENFETIKSLTRIDLTKKMDGLFAINGKRDQIDHLYAIIEKVKTLK